MADDDGLQLFLASAASHRLLTPAEEKRLGRRASQGDRDARNELVLCNIRLVISVARYYRNRGLAMSDVIQYGILGLNRAAEKYDPERDIRFSTYATLWIKQAIQRGLTSAGSAIRLPSTVAASRAKARTAMTNNPDASGQDIADMLDLGVHEVERALRAAEVVTSLDRTIATDDHEHTLLDAMRDHSAEDPFDLVTDDISEDVHNAMLALERPHRRVIEMAFGLTGKPPMTSKEIALKVGKSENTVKMLRGEAMEFLSHRLAQHR